MTPEQFEELKGLINGLKIDTEDTLKIPEIINSLDTIKRELSDIKTILNELIDNT